MKAAVTAAETGHRVTLAEAGPQLGGQARLAQLLPDRAEFGGLVTNLVRELERRQVEVRLNTRIDAAALEALDPEAVIVATGSRPLPIEVEGAPSDQLVEATDVLAGRAQVGARVVVADWRCDWQGIGVAMFLQRQGHHVRLAVNGLGAGQNLQPYVRDHWAGKLHAAGIEVTPYARLYGVAGDSAFFLHAASGAAMEMEGVDTVVLASGRAPDDAVEKLLRGTRLPHAVVGDALIARGAEEAVYDGMVITRDFLTGLAAPVAEQA